MPTDLPFLYRMLDPTSLSDEISSLHNIGAFPLILSAETKYYDQFDADDGPDLEIVLRTLIRSVIPVPERPLVSQPYSDFSSHLPYLLNQVGQNSHTIQNPSV